MSLTCIQWEQPEKGRFTTISYLNYNQEIKEKNMYQKIEGALRNYLNIVYKLTYQSASN